MDYPDEKKDNNFMNLVELLHYFYIDANNLATPETEKELTEEAKFNPLVLEYKLARVYYENDPKGLNDYKKQMIDRFSPNEYIQATRIFSLTYLDKYSENFTDDELEV